MKNFGRRMLLAACIGVAIAGLVMVIVDFDEFLNYAMWVGIVVIGICAAVPVIYFIRWISVPPKRRRRRSRQHSV